MFKSNNILRVLALALALVMLIGMVGCGKGGEDKDNSSSKKSSTTGGGLGSRLVVTMPQTLAYGANPTFTWTGLKDGQSVNLTVLDKSGKVVEEKKGITEDSYKLSATLEHGAEYTFKAEYVTADGAVKKISNVDAEGNKFVCVTKSNNNTGANYTFDGSISLEVLNNYLDRSTTYCLAQDGSPTAFDEELFDEGIRYLLNVGAKYISRAMATWIPTNAEESTYPELKERIALAHSVDPELVFEACIFETCTEKVNSISIPDWVFKAFGKKVESRTFDSSKMIFTDGYDANKWGEGVHTPDITKEETQMFFYYRGCQYIDLGFEALHLGQAIRIGNNDKNNASWNKVTDMLRDYAKKNARRHYVILNSHYPGQNFVGPDGVMIVDFNAFPLRIRAANGEVDHAVSENNPQKVDIYPGEGTSVYKLGIKGTSPSGWTTNNYPYMVEFDNWGGKTGDNTKKDGIWGYDEISWYASQPQWYRHDILKYLTDKIHGYNENGHLALPGYRTAYIESQGKHTYYYANSTKYCENGQNDEDYIKSLWVK